MADPQRGNQAPVVAAQEAAKGEVGDTVSAQTAHDTLNPHTSAKHGEHYDSYEATKQSDGSVTVSKEHTPK